MSRRQALTDGGIHNELLSMQSYQQQQARERSERDLRLKQRDADYRAALGLSLTEPLPAALGTAGGRRAPMSAGVRGTKRPAGGAV